MNIQNYFWEFILIMSVLMITLIVDIINITFWLSVSYIFYLVTTYLT